MQKAIEAGVADFGEAVGSLMQVAAEIIESRDPLERLAMGEFALAVLDKCRDEARKTFDKNEGVGQSHH